MFPINNAAGNCNTLSKFGFHIDHNPKNLSLQTANIVIIIGAAAVRS